MIISSFSYASTPLQGTYTCSGFKVEITNTHLYIGEAYFKLLPKHDNLFVYESDIAFIQFVKGSNNNFIQIFIWNQEGFKFNVDNQSIKYPPRINVVCEKT